MIFLKFSENLRKSSAIFSLVKFGHIIKLDINQIDDRHYVIYSSHSLETLFKQNIN